MDVPDAPDEELARLRAAMLTYEASPLRHRVLLRLRGAAPSAEERERVRRHDIGAHGRIAELAVRLVGETEAITQATVDLGLVEDLSLAELQQVHEELVGRHLTSTDTLAPDLSLPFLGGPEQTALLARLLPDAPAVDDASVRRYATLVDPVVGRAEPFLVCESERPGGQRRVLGRLWLDGVFLRHEESFGTVSADDLAALEELVQADLVATLETARALRGAPAPGGRRDPT